MAQVKTKLSFFLLQPSHNMFKQVCVICETKTLPGAALGFCALFTINIVTLPALQEPKSGYKRRLKMLNIQQRGCFINVTIYTIYTQFNQHSMLPLKKKTSEKNKINGDKITVLSKVFLKTQKVMYNTQLQRGCQCNKAVGAE